MYDIFLLVVIVWNEDELFTLMFSVASFKLSSKNLLILLEIGVVPIFEGITIVSASFSHEKKTKL